MSKKKSKVIAALLSIFITTPIWFYILYQILSAIQATELTWFLYWVYLPIALFVAFVFKLSE